MSTPSTETRNPRAARPAMPATVVAANDLCSGMRRVVLHVPSLEADLPLADHYVKLVLGDVMRTYTIRAWDAEHCEMTLDFVVHGDEGIAGPWARDVQPGEAVALRGPGGGWAPAATDTDVLLVGDESAQPAIARAMELVAEQGRGARVRAFVEIAGPGNEIPMPQTGAEVTWVHRGTAVPGMALAHAARTYAVPARHDTFSAFVHGNADMLKDMRRWLFAEHGVPKERVSISGYWRHGMNDEQWRATKRDFVARLEAETAG